MAVALHGTYVQGEGALIPSATLPFTGVPANASIWVFATAWTTTVTVSDSVSGSYGAAVRHIIDGGANYYLHRLGVSPGGNPTVTVLPESSAYLTGVGLIVTGQDLTNPIADESFALHPTGATGYAASVTVDGPALLLARVSNVSGSGPFNAPAAGWTSLADTQTGGGFHNWSLIWRYVSTAGTYTASWPSHSAGSNSAGTIIVAIREASGGGPVDAPMARESALRRRIFGRTWGRVN